MAVIVEVEIRTHRTTGKEVPWCEPQRLAAGRRALVHQKVDGGGHRLQESSLMSRSGS